MELTYKWAVPSHPNKPKHWIDNRYFGQFNPFRRDRWVFGDRDSGSYLPKPAWTGIDRHQMVTERASPDDPALAEYWANRRRRSNPRWTPTPSACSPGRRTVHPVRGQPPGPRPTTPSPQGWERWSQMGHKEGDRSGLPSPRQHAQRAARPTNTPRTRRLRPDQKLHPDSRKHRGTTADDPSAPRGLLGPCARERACTVRGAAVGCGEQGVHFGLVEVGQFGAVAAFGGDGEHAGDERGVFGMAEGGVAEE